MRPTGFAYLKAGETAASAPIYSVQKYATGIRGCDTPGPATKTETNL